MNNFFEGVNMRSSEIRSHAQRGLNFKRSARDVLKKTKKPLSWPI